jgi:hypothetical protein
MTDMEFEVLLKKAVTRAAEIKYLSDMPPEDELPEPSEHHQRRIKKLINNPDLYVKRLRRPIYLKVLQKAAIFILVASVLFSAAMIHPTVRATVTNFVKTWFNDHTEYKVADDSDSAIPTKIELGYVPEDFELESEIYDTLYAGLTYISNDGRYFSVEIVGDAGTVHSDNEHSIQYTRNINNHFAYVYESNNERYPSAINYHDEKRNLLVGIVGYNPIEDLVLVLEQCEY